MCLAFANEEHDGGLGLSVVGVKDSRIVLNTQCIFGLVSMKRGHVNGKGAGWMSCMFGSDSDSDVPKCYIS